MNKKKNKKVVVEGLESLFDDAGDNGQSSALIEEIESFFDKRAAA